MICLLFFLIFASATTAKDALLCRECKDIQDPKSCSDITICGQGEICETREFTNHLGVQGFRVGCQSKTTCDLLKVAQSAFGKRQLKVDAHIPGAPPALCHECCDAQECNADLCRSAMVHTKATPPPVIGHPATNCNCSSQQTSTPHKGCPAHFLRAYNDSCYLTSIGSVSWRDARKYCQSMGAELLVFNSKAEHEFWVTKLREINATYEEFYWIGGTYDRAAGEWVWTDLAADHYALWDGGHSYPTNNYDYYVVIHNPAHGTGSPYEYAEMGFYQGGDKYPFICEKQIP